MPKVVELHRTCIACPSQWEGRLDDGRWVYVRYRHGFLSLGFGSTLEEAVEASAPVAVVGDAMDGIMSTEEMLEQTGLEVVPEALEAVLEEEEASEGSPEEIEALRREIKEALKLLEAALRRAPTSEGCDSSVVP